MLALPVALVSRFAEHLEGLVVQRPLFPLQGMMLEILRDALRSFAAFFLRLWVLGVLQPAAPRVELAEPELREQLLSAVELATDDPSAINDSPVFRSLLQGEVAQQMVEVRVGRLLPLKLIGRWALAALVFAGIAGALWMSDDPRFQQLARRAHG